MLDDLQKEMFSLGDPVRALHSQRFFKTGPGEYGEGDKFLGITVPKTRIIAKKYKNLPLEDVQKLLKSQWHEIRLLALIILVNQFKKADSSSKKEIYEFYLKNTQYINNWDLVDTSARDIVGGYIFNNQSLLPVLYKLSSSKNLWERRVAVIASFYFINNGEPDVALKLAEKLLSDKEDLIHKAVGWMLREVGKRCERQILIEFLNNYSTKMPRTTLRYAIEHFDERTRKMYLTKSTN